MSEGLASEKHLLIQARLWNVGRQSRPLGLRTQVDRGWTMMPWRLVAIHWAQVPMIWSGGRPGTRGREENAKRERGSSDMFSIMRRSNMPSLPLGKVSLPPRVTSA